LLEDGLFHFDFIMSRLGRGRFFDNQRRHTGNVFPAGARAAESDAGVVPYLFRVRFECKRSLNPILRKSSKIG
jgi:hypothetical protein